MATTSDIQLTLAHPGAHLAATCRDIERFYRENGGGIPWGVRERAISKLLLAKYLQPTRIDPKLGPLYYFTDAGLAWVQQHALLDEQADDAAA